MRGYLEGQKEKARREGVLTTVTGRRSYFPEINSKNVQLRNFAERAAVNAPIQGSAADLIKKAMITIQSELEKQSLKTLMIIQVHDELVFDLVTEERETVERLVRRGMEEAADLKVSLKVKITCGDTWFRE